MPSIRQLLKANFKYFSDQQSTDIGIENDKVAIYGNCQRKTIDTKFNNDRLPINFSAVYGYFIINNCNLTTLEGCPDLVADLFDCSTNKLKNLYGGPKEVKGNYYCPNNPLTSLEYLPEMNSNQLLTLSYDKDLPLLRLSIMRCLIIMLGDKLSRDIIELYQYKLRHNTLSKKQAILACQKALIENGYIGNAKW